MTVMRSWGLYAWAVAIALVLWLQVHGQGEGSLSMDISVQVQGLKENMVIVNDFPDRVKITVHGLQGRLKALDPQHIFIPIRVDDLEEPGIVEKTLNLQSVKLPTGVEVDKIQPDRIELQVDRIVKRNIPVLPQFDLPQGWHVENVQVVPNVTRLIGPEVWMETLTSILTVPLRLDLQSGLFKVQTRVISLAGKAVRLEEENRSFEVHGMLIKDSVDEIHAEKKE